ncbi:hypothetical protein SCAR479_03693 [Seiridium cardinale]|uniref:Uncharacterized protein n=1 Tax=Seiridium cardinale TaxID=138064 RepID=A0ABR2Y0P5_9PEZI
MGSNKTPEAQPVVNFATFDSASRGPLGSLNLFHLWRPRSLTILPLVYTASLVTISALAMGPCAQQVINIQVNNKRMWEDVNSTISVSYKYDNNYAKDGTYLTIEKNGSTGFALAYTFVVEPNMKGAFYGGYYNLGFSSFDLNCPSSDCAWLLFTSFGICSSCLDVSNTTQINETNPDLANPPAYLQTPGGWYISMNGYDKVAAKANSSSAFFPKWNNLEANIVSFVIAQTAGYFIERKYNVTECSINWQIEHFSPIIRSRKYRSGLSKDNIQEVFLRLRKYHWIGPGLLTANGNGGNDSSSSTPVGQAGFNVNIYDHLALSGFLAKILTFQGEKEDDYFASGENVVFTAANIADIMTSKILMSSPGTVAQGTMWHSESILKIRWAWLVLPLTLVAMSALLLVSTILATKRLHAPLWKSCPLPFLYHGIREWDNNEEADLSGGRLERVHAMKHQARLMSGRIVTTPEGGTWLAT